ncbi:MAG: zinc metalloprotease [Planctomycetes bacterium]|nr:zinc metalloprotease [Planctomycetota bacterium]
MRFSPLRLGGSTALLALALTGATTAQNLRTIDFTDNELLKDYFFEETAHGIVTADVNGTYLFKDFSEYVQSSFFMDHGMRCGSDRLPQFLALGAPVDCSSSNTTIKPEYDPSTGTITIPVWVHEIRNTAGTLGVLNGTQISSQISALNSAFSSAGFQFTLAGTTLTKNNSNYNDRGTYYNTLARDVNNNLNIYTNTASGNLGYAYVPNGGGVVGNKFDRVVIYYKALGKPGTYGAPYNEGDTTVHEVGHYLGLYHTFQGGCASASGCATNGDLICDTQPEGAAHFSPCTDPATCGNPDPITNFMDYSDDPCMNNFSSNQKNRMHCTVNNYRTRISNTVP